MARLASQAVAGYYPFPSAHLPAVAALVDTTAFRASNGVAALLDPCAGDGAAILTLHHLWSGDPKQQRSTSGPRLTVYGCELEDGRAKAFHSAVNRRLGYVAEGQCLAGDLFRVAASLRGTYEHYAGASLCWFNPPYDTDPVHGRLEQRFLDRVTPWIASGGILIAIVPQHALTASAVHLASHYQQLWCYRLPDPDFAVYQQVVLIGIKAAHPVAFDVESHPLVRTVQQWATAASLPVLPAPGTAVPVVQLPVHKGGFAQWALAPVDTTAVYDEVRPWMQGSVAKPQPVGGLALERDLADLIGRVHPVAMPLKAGHIAQALAAGMLNGAQITPDDPDSGLPPLLMKGVFEREYRTTETKTNKKGETTAYVQVQQPRLRVSVLDLRSSTYYDLAAGSEVTGATSLDQMTIADVLTRYGKGLGKLLAQQCPPLHHPADPSHQIALPIAAREPFRAQRAAVQTGIKLLGQGLNPFLLGEVGTGKSLMSLLMALALTPPHYATTRAELRRLGIGWDARLRPVQRVLVLCPPHLLTSWTNEVVATLPGAEVRLLSNPSEVAAFARDPLPTSGVAVPGTRLRVGVLSRETAKLGHPVIAGFEDSNPVCPRCGERITTPATTVVHERQRCKATARVAVDPVARMAVDLAQLLATASESWQARSLVQGAVLRRHVRRAHEALDALESAEARVAARRGLFAQRALRGAADGLQRTPAGVLIGRVTDHVVAQLHGRETIHGAKDLVKALGMLCWSIDHEERDALFAAVIERLYRATLHDRGRYSSSSQVRDLLRTLTLLLAPGSETQQQLLARLTALSVEDSWSEHAGQLARLTREATKDGPEAVQGYESRTVTTLPGGFIGWRHTYQTTYAAGDVAAAELALATLVARGTFERTAPCGEFLYQASPNPRRVPLATFIARHYPRSFDLLVVDEGHEYNNDGTAQERAAHRLVGCNAPTLVLSGSILNGYVSSLFSNLWALSPRFRATFSREERGAFVTRYGYRKRLVELDSDRDSRVRRFGNMSDRVEDSDAQAQHRALGEAPGVLPLFLLDWMLPMACTIHKADLDEELPEMIEIPVYLPATSPVAVQLRDRAKQLQGALVQQIAKDRFDTTGKAGALFGALGQAVTFPDRATADTGNITLPDGSRAWHSAYPERLGGEVVVAPVLFPADTVLPKEAWMLKTLAAELAEGRHCLVFVTNSSADSGLVRRLQRLITAALGPVVATLDPAKVPTQTRQTWIDAEVIGKGKGVLIVNAQTIKTGLNNLVPWFSTAIWMQNPDANAITYRQANGRLHRIGQTNPVRIYMPVYASGPQALAMQLLGRKVSASLAVDGLDLTSALDAVGAGTGEGVQVLELGRALYELAVATANQTWQQAA